MCVLPTLVRALTLLTAVYIQPVFGNKTFPLTEGPAQNVIYLNIPSYGGVVVVGGTNAIYMLSAEDLSERAVYKTGPQNDSVLCPPYPLACDYDSNRTTTDNYNRVLLQIGTNLAVLACGTASQGMCSIHYLLHDLNVTKSMNKTLKDNYVASQYSTVAFFGTGISKNVLFAASTYGGRPEEYHPYAVSSRVLLNSESLSLFSSTEGMPTFVNVTGGLKPSCPISYIYGFSLNGFAYFVTVHTTLVSSELSKTWLARVCEDDKSFRTYMEVPIQCPQQGGVLSDIATSASMVPLNVDSEAPSNVLAVAFTRNFKNHTSARRSRPESILCFFDMNDVQEAFRNTAEACSMGKDIARLSPVYRQSEEDLQCKVHKPSGDITCTPGENSYVESLVPLTGRAELTLPERVTTSITLMQQNSTTVVWVGDDQGFLHKVLLRDDSTYLLTSLNFSKFGNTGVRQSTAIDDKGAYGFFLIGDKVVQVPIGSCSIYEDCSQCVQSFEDPLGCGWCGNRCTNYEECSQHGQSFRDRCPIHVDRVYPKSGSVYGGTLITLEGDNVGAPNHKPHSRTEILVGGKECHVVHWSNKKVMCRTSDGLTKSKVDILITHRNGTKTYDVLDSHVIRSGFEYKVVKYYGLTPNYGPVSGTTNITVSGLNLDVGSEQAVKVGKTICRIQRISSKFLECSLDAAAGDQVNQEVNVTVKIDNVVVPFVSRNGLGASFTFKPDPIITDITPKRSTFSGNFNVTVKGAHLDSVAKPIIVTRVSSPDWVKQDCIKKECQAMEIGQMMLCPGTPLVEFSMIRNAQLEAINSDIQAEIGFLMDGLKLPSNVSGKTENFVFVYQPPPQFDSFPEGGQSVDPNDPSLEITGSHLEILTGSEHLSVRLNGVDHSCNLSSVTDRAVVCKLRSDILTRGSPHAFEVVYAGRSYSVGYVSLLSDDSSSDAGPISIAVGISLLVVLFGVGTCLRFRKLHREKNASQSRRRTDVGMFQLKRIAQRTTDNCGANSSNTDPEAPLLNLACELDEETKLMLQGSKRLFSRELLILGPVIGQGHFGCVYRGTLKTGGSGQVISVAVKTVRKSSSGGGADCRSFLEEALIMKDFDHPNVLPLTGLSIDKKEGLMVITPYMKHGDLLSYIRDEKNLPTVKQLITFGIDVAKGMKYLANMKYVHRDLAARNCMLNEDLVVRVADFGLSRDVYEKEYYSSDSRNTKLPVRWMAPESLERSTYSSKTDVWSYGVLLWELITRGVTPYPDVDNWDIAKFLRQGRRMEQPDFCPKELYSLMLQCWQNDPDLRPPFEKLVTEVANIITKLEKTESRRRVVLSVTYTNIPRADSTCVPSHSSNHFPLR